jgi:hypothetical protein
MPQREQRRHAGPSAGSRRDLEQPGIVGRRLRRFESRRAAMGMARLLGRGAGPVKGITPPRLRAARLRRASCR